MSEAKKRPWRLSPELGAYRGVKNEVADVEPDPVKTSQTLPADAVPREATNIPYRGVGASVEHGVKPTEHAEPFDDQFAQASRAANRPPVEYEPVVEEIPFPVKVVSVKPPEREEKIFHTDSVSVTDTVQNLLGDDRCRTRLLLKNPSGSAGVVLVGHDQNALRTGAGYPLPNSDTYEMELTTTKAVWIVAETTATIYFLVERVREL